MQQALFTTPVASPQGTSLHPLQQLPRPTLGLPMPQSAELDVPNLPIYLTEAAAYTSTATIRYMAIAIKGHPLDPDHDEILLDVLLVNNGEPPGQRITELLTESLGQEWRFWNCWEPELVSEF